MSDDLTALIDSAVGGFSEIITPVIILVGVLVFAYLLYKGFEWFFLKRHKIDFLSINFKTLKAAAQKNLIKGCENQSLFVFGGGNNFGMIKGTAHTQTISRAPAMKGDPGAIKLERIENNKPLEYYEKSVLIDEVVFYVNLEKNAFLRWFRNVFTFLEKTDLIIVPFKQIVCERYNEKTQEYEKTRIEKYNDLRGHIFLDINSLIPHADGIMRPNTYDVSAVNISALDDQIYKHRYILGINENADQVRKASYSNAGFVKQMETKSVERQALANRSEE